MQKRRTLGRLITAVALLVAFLCQGTWALAGSTGALGGNISDEAGKPVANATVTATAPSGIASVTTDAAGHFVFLSLSPDTYTLSVKKANYADASLGGNTVFADQVQNVAIVLHPALTTIVHTVSTSAGNLVKSGTTSDIYSVNASTQDAIKALGGGGNMNSAYSAIYSVPGVSSYIGNYGFGQVFYIRGSEYNQVGYEFDGVPVNRAFDNYNGSSLSNLGQQELQVYTGAAPAGAATATVGGYINQVIKTGTYPGYGTAQVSLGGPTFYHNAQIETGGASPNRLFSYYAAIGGYNQQFRLFNAQNGGNLSIQDGWEGPASEFTTQYYGNGVTACNPDGTNPNAPLQTEYLTGAGCIGFGPAGGMDYDTTNSDREATFNFHFGLPHKNDGGKDDIQLLFTNSSYNTAYAESNSDLGGVAGYTAMSGAKQFGYWGGTASNTWCTVFGLCNAAGTQVAIPFEDGKIFAAGTTFGQAANTATTIPYLFPNTGLNRTPGSAEPNQLRNTIFNNSSIIKAQYQKNIGTTAYARIYAYALYSDWLQNGPTFGASDYVGDNQWCCSGGVSRDYELNAHTRGGEFQYANQFNSQNLLTFTANYVTSTVGRFNNGTMSNTSSTTSTNLTDGTNCYSYTTGALGSCLSSGTSGTYGSPTRGLSEAACGTPALAGTPACTSGATWLVTKPAESGTYNAVTPKFSSFSLTDEFRPNDKLDLNLGVRMETFEYDRPAAGSDFPFWYTAAANSYCYNLTTLAPVLAVVPFGSTGPGAPVVVQGECQASLLAGPNTAHPSATDPENTDGLVYSAGGGANKLTNTLFSPRLAFTYTLDPDTVVRGSYGRYVEPVTTATVQYLDKSGKTSAAFNFSNFWQYGYTTPLHNLVPQTSNNVDFSLEKRLHGTDISFKLSPFYRYTTNQLNSIAIGPNFVSALNVGTQRSQGVEFEIQKGDPSKNGFAGAISYTYTNARIKFSNLSNGRNTIDPLNDYIKYYNALTSAGGGSACYQPGYIGGVPNPAAGQPVACGGTAIANPYYNSAPQPLLDRNGWYETYPNNDPYQPADGQSTAIAPNVFAGYLNWKHDRLTITPTFQLNQGTDYGTPVDVYGLDPRYCGGNQANGGPNVYTGSTFGPLATTTPGNANYLTCGPSAITGNGFLAIPNPQTGTFDSLGQYTQPWQFNLGLAASYELSNKVKATLTLANLYNRCFGGSTTSWSSAFKPSSLVCGYGTNGSFYQSNFYNGSGPNDAVNGTLPKVLQEPFAPFGPGLPFQAYFEVQIKL
jgi:hypothetical protein